LPNVGPYIYTTLAFLALLGAPYIYDISSLRVKQTSHHAFLLHMIVILHTITTITTMNTFIFCEELSLNYRFLQIYQA